VMGLTFKENCTDLRNSKVIDIIHELERFGAKVDVFDPWIEVKEAQQEYGVKPLRRLGRTRYDAAVLAVAHNEFREMGIKGVRKLLKPTSVVYDIKHVFKRNQVDGRL
jgi:UDP-N-acetyl-D-glucosamine/UDP-N-acetyl-D-galactosamine dehydrogenase